MNFTQSIKHISQVALLAMMTGLALVACSADDPVGGSAITSSGDPRTGPVTPTDSDGDGTVNASDNCPGIANPAQADMNRNGIGDVCDDSDADGVMDAADNCPLVGNATQLDSNADGIGNACANDFDGDGVLDNGASPDNCPSVANPGQQDANTNGIGDACEVATVTDADADGVTDTGGAADNCVGVYNPNQQDSNGNGVGDVCDTPIKNVCGAGYRPFLEPEAAAFNSPTSSLLGITLSKVSNVSALTDTNATNYASLNLVADALGLLGTAYAGVRTVLSQPQGHEVGFVISGTPSLVNLTLLTGVAVQTLNGAAVSESFTDSTTLSLGLLTGSSDKGLLRLTPTKPFDAVRINIGGAASVLSSLRVHATWPPFVITRSRAPPGCPVYLLQRARGQIVY